MTLVMRLSIWGVTPTLTGSTSSPFLIASHKWLTTVVVFSPRRDATSSYNRKHTPYNWQFYLRSNFGTISYILLIVKVLFHLQYILLSNDLLHNMIFKIIKLSVIKVRYSILGLKYWILLRNFLIFWQTVLGNQNLVSVKLDIFYCIFYVNNSNENINLPISKYHGIFISMSIFALLGLMTKLYQRFVF